MLYSHTVFVYTISPNYVPQQRFRKFLYASTRIHNGPEICQNLSGTIMAQTYKALLKVCFLVEGMFISYPFPSRNFCKHVFFNKHQIISDQGNACKSPSSLLRGGGQSLPKTPALQNLREKIEGAFYSIGPGCALLKEFLHKLFPTRTNPAQPRGEKKISFPRKLSPAGC